MNLVKAIGEGLITVIQWVGMVYQGFCDRIGISEWTILFAAIGLIGFITIGKFLYKK